MKTVRLLDTEWRQAWAQSAPGEMALDLEPELPLNDLPRAWSAAPGLCAEGIGVQIGASRLLDGVHLALQPGEVGAVLGPNGAGKSTLLSVLSGLRPPAAGRVLMGGRPLADLPPEPLALQRAVMSQDTAVAFDFTVQDVVGLGRYPHRLRPAADEAGIVRQAMALTDVAHLAGRMVNSLSGGERARTQLARVLAQIWHPLPDHQPRWLLLDEPTAALDLRHQHGTLATVRRWAREQGVGVLAVLHDLNLALRYADRVWVLDHGRLQASGVPAQVLTPALLQRVWQVPAQPVRGADGCLQLLVGGSSGSDDSGRTP